MSKFMIYGANGYTGELIARESEKRGLKPILAGRSESKVRLLADELGFEARIFDLDHADANLQDVDTVIHCAGPFSATSAPMIEACLKAKTHYLDITGEIEVFEHAHAQHDRAKEAGIVVCPGVGFDVIPTDCVAARLKEVLPDATHLALGFESRSKNSPGTAKTSVEGLASGGKVRQDGKIITVPLGYKTRNIDFGTGEHLGATIPWGDVSTAYYSTGIPNIEVYMSVPPKLVKGMKAANKMRWLLALPPVQAIMKKQAGKNAVGMDEATRERFPMYVWGEATNAKGETKTARVKTANGYTTTFHGALAVTDFLENNDVQGGAYTPSKLCGWALVESLEGAEKISVT